MLTPVSCQDGDLVTFTEEVLNGKLHFLCSAKLNKYLKYLMMLVYLRFVYCIMLHSS